MKTLCYAFAMVFVVGFCAVALAQDPNVVAPDVYKKIFENDRVKVHQVTSKPGEKIAMHSHPAHVAYILTPCTLKITPKDGEPQTANAKEGDVIWFDAVTHTGENVGTSECRVVIVELKETM
jgi:quercetin dioxygenase-like cupin family protein